MAEENDKTEAKMEINSAEDEKKPKKVVKIIRSAQLTLDENNQESEDSKPTGPKDAKDLLSEFQQEAKLTDNTAESAPVSTETELNEGRDAKNAFKLFKEAKFIPGKHSSDGKYTRTVLLCDATYMFLRGLQTSDGSIPDIISVYYLKVRQIESLLTTYYESHAAKNEKILAIALLRYADGLFFKSFPLCFKKKHPPMKEIALHSEAPDIHLFKSVASAVGSIGDGAIDFLYASMMPCNSYQVQKQLTHKHAVVAKHWLKGYKQFMENSLECCLQYTKCCIKLNSELRHNSLTRVSNSPSCTLFPWVHKAFKKRGFHPDNLPFDESGYSFVKSVRPYIRNRLTNFIEICNNSDEQNETVQSVVFLGYQKMAPITECWSSDYCPSESTFELLPIKPDAKKLMDNLKSKYNNGKHIFIYFFNVKKLLDIKSHSECKDHVTLKYPVCKDGIESFSSKILHEMKDVRQEFSSVLPNSKLVFSTFHPVDFRCFIPNLYSKHKLTTKHDCKESFPTEYMKEQNKLFLESISVINDVICTENHDFVQASFNLYEFTIDVPNDKFIGLSDGLNLDSDQYPILAKKINESIKQMNSLGLQKRSVHDRLSRKSSKDIHKRLEYSTSLSKNGENMSIECEELSNCDSEEIDMINYENSHNNIDEYSYQNDKYDDEQQHERDIIYENKLTADLTDITSLDADEFDNPSECIDITRQLKDRLSEPIAVSEIPLGNVLYDTANTNGIRNSTFTPPTFDSLRLDSGILDDIEARGRSASRIAKYPSEFGRDVSSPRERLQYDRNSNDFHSDSRTEVYPKMRLSSCDKEDVRNYSTFQSKSFHSPISRRRPRTPSPRVSPPYKRSNRNDYERQGDKLLDHRRSFEDSPPRDTMQIRGRRYMSRSKSPRMYKKEHSIDIETSHNSSTRIGNDREEIDIGNKFDDRHYADYVRNREAADMDYRRQVQKHAKERHLSYERHGEYGMVSVEREKRRRSRSSDERRSRIGSPGEERMTRDDRYVDSKHERRSMDHVPNRKRLRASTINSAEQENRAEEALRSLRGIHERECDMYRKEPETHPDYEKERSSFIRKKSQEYYDAGRPVDQHELREAFYQYWNFKIEHLFDISWEEKKTKCLDILHERSIGENLRDDRKLRREMRPDRAPEKYDNVRKDVIAGVNETELLQKINAELQKTESILYKTKTRSTDPRITPPLVASRGSHTSYEAYDKSRHHSKYEPEQETSISKRRSSASKSKEDSRAVPNDPYDVLETLKILSEMPERFGDLTFPLSSIYRTALNAQSKNLDILSIFSEQEIKILKMALQVLRNLRVSNLSVIQKVITDEALNRIEKLLFHIHEKFDPYFGLNPDHLADAVSSLSPSDAIAHIKQLIVNRDFPYIKDSQILKIYMSLQGR